MSWLIVGTVTYEEFPLLLGRCSLENGTLNVGGKAVPVARGTPALISAAVLAAQLLQTEPPTALLAGDTGKGRGSERIYGHLVNTLPGLSDSLIVFHYLQPDIDWHNRILLGLQEMRDRPTLVADAGYMYVAKMSGFADSYDLFTPDIGELAFLADESAPHPFYTRGFLLQEEDKAEELVERAYEHQNAARYLLVKGKCDLVASADGILARIHEPCVENMEPIGGTGDTLTGIVAALIQSGKPIAEAATLAAASNRFMGLLSNPTPAFSVSDLLPRLADAVTEAVKSSSSHVIEPL
ncbi:MAG: NAD(P)H-hydrate dehydratase [Desulfomonilaceae bacterium]|nr:NAD(P)H-hydrate dehydratase [Desulfomonilaceae bacterium]